MLRSTFGQRGNRVLALALAGTLLVASVTIAAASPSFARLFDPGAKYERDLNNNSKDYFGFGKPVAQSANTPSNTEPGDKAVVVTKGLKARTDFHSISN